jgi:MoaA/NifB/PqqE/SkfB family radical SAM enzyme
MNALKTITDIFPKIANYKLARRGLIKPAAPINITFSVTNMCQSRCLTCNIYRMYKKEFQDGCFRENTLSPKDELKLEEYEKLFKSIGHVYFVNMSGGEPFLRKDFADIVEMANKYLTPQVIHTPTNALMPEKIHSVTRDILERLHRSGRKVTFTIKPSFDGVGAVHDFVRGVPGNFDKLLQTYELLLPLKEEYHNIEIGAGTVISTFNIDKLEETSQYVHQMKLDSYINEIAEHRTEMFNSDERITPSAEAYEQAIRIFKRESMRHWENAGKLGRYTQAMRMVYYDTVVEILQKKTQVLPCYAGISNVHVSPHGEVWPCAILGYDKSFGNIRDADYDFWKIWHSEQADDVRKYIRNLKCWCPLANQAYSNILCSPKAMAKAFVTKMNMSRLSETNCGCDEQRYQINPAQEAENKEGESFRAGD